MVADKLQDVEITARWHNVYLGTSITFLTSTIVFMSLYFAESCSTTAPTAPIYNTSIVVGAATPSNMLGIPNCLTLDTRTVNFDYICAIDLGPKRADDIEPTSVGYDYRFSTQHFDRITALIKMPYKSNPNTVGKWFPSYTDDDMLKCCCANKQYRNPPSSATYESALDLCHVDARRLPLQCDKSKYIPKSPTALCKYDGGGSGIDQSQVMEIRQTQAKITCNDKSSGSSGWDGYTRLINNNRYLIMLCMRA